MLKLRCSGVKTSVIIPSELHKMVRKIIEFANIYFVKIFFIFHMIIFKHKV